MVKNWAVRGQERGKHFPYQVQGTVWIRSTKDDTSGRAASNESPSDQHQNNVVML